MIETIYNGENNEGKKAEVNIRLPKNIRQIGQGDKNLNNQIYIEENVLSYIKKAPLNSEKLRYGVLLGDVKKGNGYTYIFINGMVDATNVIENTIIFSDDVWTDIYDNMRRYYRNDMVIGWFVTASENTLDDMHSIKKLHLDNFAGNDKVFLGINLEEGEEGFYVYERNGLKKQPCYHVYFEKSYEFEDYLFGTGKSVEEDKKTVVKDGGKYGIAINNMNVEKRLEAKRSIEIKELTDEKEEKSKVINLSKYSRVASVATILVLAGVLAMMGRNGQLDTLSNKLEGAVGSILGNNETVGDGFVSVNGNITLNKEEKSSSTTEKGTSTENTTEEETSTEKESDTKLTETDVEEKDTTSLDKNEDINGREEETTKSASASVSLPNENYETHIVKAGETLYGIVMKKYGAADKLEDVIKLNKLGDGSYVIEGQKILLP